LDKRTPSSRKVLPLGAKGVERALAEKMPSSRKALALAIKGIERTPGERTPSSRRTLKAWKECWAKRHPTQGALAKI